MKIDTTYSMNPLNVLNPTLLEDEVIQGIDTECKADEFLCTPILMESEKVNKIDT